MHDKSRNNPTGTDRAQWTRMLWGAASALALSLATTSVHAQTWLGNDATDPTDFNLGANWSTGTVPGFNQTATFGNAGSTSVNVTAETNLGSGGLSFVSAAPAFTINLESTLNLTSISNDSGATQTIDIGQFWLHFTDAGSVTGPVTINQSGTGVIQFDASYDASAASITAAGALGGVLVRGDGATVSIGSLSGSDGRVAFQGAGSMLEVGALNQDDTFTGSFTTQDGGSGGIRKIGTGTQWLSLQSGLGSYSGPTEVVSGTLNMGTQYSFGTADSGTTVAEGATLGLYGDSYTVSDAISLAGTGVDNAGALRNLENNHTLTGQITLSGNARIVSDAGMLTIAGTIVKDNFDRIWLGGAGDITVSSSISGDGQLEKHGSGTLVLSGSNTHAGWTIILDGTLRAGAENTFSRYSSLSIAQTATVDLNDLDQTVKSLDGDSGAQLSLGTATLTLAGWPLHPTTEYEGDISGTGGIVKNGAYTQEFLGSNTYSGATLLNSGRILAKGQDSLSANSAHVVAAGAFLDLSDFDQTIGSLAGAGEVGLGAQSLTAGGDNTSTTFSGTMSGTGGFTKAGTGAMTFEGTQDYFGATTIAGGTLAVNSTLVNSATTVNSGGTLKGTGNLLGVTVASGGVHAPGNSIGTQYVDGPYILQAGAILEIEANAAGQSDVVVVNGTVNITGATLRVLADGGNYALATSYLIIDNDSDDDVEGTFGPITSDLAFLTPTVDYASDDAALGADGNDVVLTLTRNDVSFTDVAETPNQFAVASGLNGLPVNNPLVVAVFGQSAEGARQAFDALSGEVYGSVGTVLTNDSRLTRRIILSRLQQASAGGAQGGATQFAATGTNAPVTVAGSFDAPMALGMGRGKSLSGYDIPAAASPLVFWTQGFGSWGDFDGNGNAASADRTIGGFLSGADADLGAGWRAGLALGYSQSSIGVGARLSSANIDSYHLSLYTGGMAGAVALRGGGVWSWNDIDAKRTVAFPGFLDRVDSSYNGDVGQIFAEAALPLSAGAIAYEPFANLAYVHVATERFTEQGGTAALDGFGGSNSTGFTTLGLRLAANAAFGDARIVPRASFAWQYAFGDIDPLQALAFSSGGPAFGISGVPLARNAALIDAGFDVFLAPDATLSLSYNGELASDIEDHGVSGRLNWRF